MILDLLADAAANADADSAPKPVAYPTPTVYTWDAGFQFSAGFLGAAFIFAVVLFIGTTVVVLRSREGFSERYLRITIIILIVTLAIGVTAANSSQQQVGAVLGLLGTIIGYVLGRGDLRQNSTPAPATRDDTAEPRGQKPQT